MRIAKPIEERKGDKGYLTQQEEGKEKKISINETRTNRDYKIEWWKYTRVRIFLWGMELP